MPELAPVMNTILSFRDRLTGSQVLAFCCSLHVATMRQDREISRPWE